MNQNEKLVALPRQLFDAVFQYLTERPYREVSPIVDELKNSVQMVEVPQTEEMDNDGDE